MFFPRLTIWQMTWRRTHQGPGSALKSITPLKTLISPICLAATQPQLSQMGFQSENTFKKKSIAIPTALFLLLPSYSVL